MSGVVLTKNLANRVGEALELGKPFCEIAGRDVYEVQVDIKEQESRHRDRRLAPWQIPPSGFHPPLRIRTSPCIARSTARRPSARRRTSSREAVFSRCAPRSQWTTPSARRSQTRLHRQGEDRPRPPPACGGDDAQISRLLESTMELLTRRDWKKASCLLAVLCLCAGILRGGG